MAADGGEVVPSTVMVCSGKGDEPISQDARLGNVAERQWRQRLEAIARANRALFRAHPWAAAISTVRPPLGPGLMAKYERELQALDRLGLTDLEMDDALAFVLSYVRGCALAEAEVRAATHESGADDRQWWETSAPLLARSLDATVYPIAARVGTAAGTAHGAAYNPDHAFEFGLQRVLDGLASLIERRPSRRPSATGS